MKARKQFRGLDAEVVFRNALRKITRTAEDRAQSAGDGPMGKPGRMGAISAHDQARTASRRLVSAIEHVKRSPVATPADRDRYMQFMLYLELLQQNSKKS